MGLNGIRNVTIEFPRPAFTGNVQFHDGLRDVRKLSKEHD